jgi:sec-independent protein translocase protein TatA
MTSGLLAPSHLILLALAALLIFGPKRLPEIGRSLGKGLREFKDAVTGSEGNDPKAEQPQLKTSPAVETGSLSESASDVVFDPDARRD